jgi:hypothetical protein
MSARPTIGPMTAPAIQALEPLLLLLLLSLLFVLSDPSPEEAGAGCCKEPAGVMSGMFDRVTKAVLMTYVVGKKPPWQMQESCDSMTNSLRTDRRQCPSLGWNRQSFRI